MFYFSNASTSDPVKTLIEMYCGNNPEDPAYKNDYPPDIRKAMTDKAKTNIDLLKYYAKVLYDAEIDNIQRNITPRGSALRLFHLAEYGRLAQVGQSKDFKILDHKDSLKEETAIANFFREVSCGISSHSIHEGLSPTYKELLSRREFGFLSVKDQRDVRENYEPLPENINEGLRRLVALEQLFVRCGLNVKDVINQPCFDPWFEIQKTERGAFEQVDRHGNPHAKIIPLRPKTPA